MTGTILITAVNDAPIAIADVASGLEDNQISINPLTNDTDIDGDALHLLDFTQGSHGSVTAVGNLLTYTPAPN